MMSHVVLLLCLMAFSTNAFLIGERRYSRAESEEERVCLLDVCMKIFRERVGPEPDWRYGDIVTQGYHDRCKTHVPELYECLTDTIRDERADICANCTTQEVAHIQNAMQEGEHMLAENICVRPCRMSMRSHCGKLCFPLHKKLLDGSLRISDLPAVSDCTECARGLATVCPHLFPDTADKWQIIFNSAVRGCPVVKHYLQKDCHWPEPVDYQDTCYKLDEWATQYQDCKETDLLNTIGCEEITTLREGDIQQNTQEMGHKCAEFYQGQAFERKCAAKVREGDDEDTVNSMRHW